jgi:hypothetical protein
MDDILGARDLQTVGAPLLHWADRAASMVERDGDEVIGTQPAAFPLEPGILTAALRVVAERLGGLTRHEAAERCPDSVWDLAQRLLALTADFLEDAGHAAAAELVAAHGAVQGELMRLLVIGVIPPQTGEEAHVSLAEPLPACPDYLPEGLS